MRYSFSSHCPTKMVFCVNIVGDVAAYVHMVHLCIGGSAVNRARSNKLAQYYLSKVKIASDNIFCLAFSRCVDVIRFLLIFSLSSCVCRMVADDKELPFYVCKCVRCVVAFYLYMIDSMETNWVELVVVAVYLSNGFAISRYSLLDLWLLCAFVPTTTDRNVLMHGIDG